MPSRTEQPSLSCASCEHPAEAWILTTGVEPAVSFSLPFFAAAGCALLALLSLRWLEKPVFPAAALRPAALVWTDLARRIRVPLAVAMAGQVAVALFETTFALHARTDLGMGLVEIGGLAPSGIRPRLVVSSEQTSSDQIDTPFEAKDRLAIRTNAPGRFEWRPAPESVIFARVAA